MFREKLDVAQNITNAAGWFITLELMDWNQEIEEKEKVIWSERLNFT